MRALHYLIFLANFLSVLCLNLTYLDPTVLQTKTSADIQQQTATDIIGNYLSSGTFTVVVQPVLFQDSKDVFTLRTVNGVLQIRASTGVAAVWGFNYYLKKYCRSQIAWQVRRVSVPSPLPEVNEVVVANDRFRYYQNVCTASYSFVWWTVDDWVKHVEWMALNGINVGLAPVAQEAVWAEIYERLGMTDQEIAEHFTGPAFLAWLRMGNVHGWSGPLLRSWHDRQRNIEDKVVDYMYRLGMVPVLPAFNGHVPRAFRRIFPNATFSTVQPWNKFNNDYCCNLFLQPTEPLFKELGTMFLKNITARHGFSNIYAADPFNEVIMEPWSDHVVRETSKAIFSTIEGVDGNAVWLIQNWMFVHDPVLWPLDRVRTFLTSVPNGRMLVLDLQSEQWPQYELYDMYYGQPFVWCMLHNFGGTLGMFGNTKSINKNVYEARNLRNSTMIGVGLTPEGINQNYVVYDLMLESAWRKTPIEDLNAWVEAYAERRYGCNGTSLAWRYLLRSVYSFDGLNRMRGKYAVTRRPSFKIRPWAWYSGHDIFEALKYFVFSDPNACNSDGYNHDLVDVTRQALQYRTDQLYLKILEDRSSQLYVFNSSINRFLDAMGDMESILATNGDFSTQNFFDAARQVASNRLESYLYELNARNQITLWGPTGEISDYACKQWAEMFHYYYIPRWSKFLSLALDAKARGETFDEKTAQRVVRASVEEQFPSVTIDALPRQDANMLALRLYEKWAHVSDLEDLPISVIREIPNKRTTLADVALEENAEDDIITVVTEKYISK
ncbi:alpha-N-acetylglucosaminidase [Aricia agestis]|uniref:alpha-N-acetylglucosaminidase n=1 Tax=Aricia agestis TaxID=91739 RepID=UPI001C209C2B|nr:alpha-N-acetylglucosaminidase [Aricia agestis]